MNFYDEIPTRVLAEFKARGDYTVFRACLMKEPISKVSLYKRPDVILYHFTVKF